LVELAAAVTSASRMVASVEPLVKGMAVDWADGWPAMGERESEAGAGAVPGAPMPVEVGTLVTGVSS
jgi:hypothetical protein